MIIAVAMTFATVSLLPVCLANRAVIVAPSFRIRLSNIRRANGFW
jgi:hypothetical protein